jgi:small subunit ribosomal protein S6
MRYYETLYLINPDLKTEEYEGVLAKFSGIVEKSNGVVIKVDEWGKRNLAYAVKKFHKGHYVLLTYCGDSGITALLERDLKLDDKILKFQTVKLSDFADPEALKAELEEPHAAPSEETEEKEETEKPVDSESLEKIEGEEA